MAQKQLTPKERIALVLADLRSEGGTRVGEKSKKEKLTGNPVIDAEILGDIEVPNPSSGEFFDQADALMNAGGSADLTKEQANAIRAGMDSTSAENIKSANEQIEQVRGGAKGIIEGTTKLKNTEEDAPIEDKLRFAIKNGDFSSASEILSLLKEDLTPEAMLIDKIRGLRERREGKPESRAFTKSGAFRGDKTSALEAVRGLQKDEFTKDITKRQQARLDKQEKIREKQFKINVAKTIKAFEQDSLKTEKLILEIEKLEKASKLIPSAKKLKVQKALKDNADRAHDLQSQMDSTKNTAIKTQLQRAIDELSRQSANLQGVGGGNVSESRLERIRKARLNKRGK